MDQIMKYNVKLLNKVPYPKKTNFYLIYLIYIIFLHLSLLECVQHICC